MGTRTGGDTAVGRRPAMTSSGPVPPGGEHHAPRVAHDEHGAEHPVDLEPHAVAEPRREREADIRRETLRLREGGASANLHEDPVGDPENGEVTLGSSHTHTQIWI